MDYMSYISTVRLRDMDIQEQVYWCDLCECYSTISEETPWGTCLCS